MSVHREPVFPPFNPFVRHTTSTLGKVKMLLCGTVLVPIRATGAIATMTLCLIWCNICSLGCDLSKPYSPLRRQLLQGGCRIFSRVLLFWYGFLWIRETYEIEDPVERARQSHPSVVVVNHIGFSELLYLVYSNGCCFVSKHANLKLPFIGKISQCLQSIFVNRAPEQPKSTDGGLTHRDSSNVIRTTTDKILERARSPVDTWPPLVLCPEGTTHTGRVLLRFATSAFRAGLPVQPVVVKSPFSPKHGYDPSFSCSNIVIHILSLMSQPMNHLHVTHLAVYVPNEEEKKDPQLFANNVRQKMADKLGVECYDLTWTDKLRFESTANARELGRQKLAARNGGVVPPMPTFTEDAFGNALIEESAKDK